MLRHALLLIFLLPLTAGAQDCTKENDEFTGKAIINCEGEQVYVEEQPLEDISYVTISAIATGNSKDVYVAVTARAESWNWIGDDQVYMLAGGDRYRFQAIRGESEIEDGVVIEQIIVKIPLHYAEDIQHTERPRMKAGNGVFRMEPLPAQLREVLRLVGY